MFWGVLILGYLLRLRFDVCVAMLACWLLALWIETGEPTPLALLQVLGVVTLVVVMYWATFLRKRNI